MPTDLSLDELQRLLRDGKVQLIEVLPEQDFAEEHLPGAISIPLKTMSKDAVRGLDPSLPTIVYCWDGT